MIVLTSAIGAGGWGKGRNKMQSNDQGRIPESLFTET